MNKNMKWTVQERFQLSRWRSIMQFESRDAAENYVADRMKVKHPPTLRIILKPENPERFIRDKRGRSRVIGLPQHFQLVGNVPTQKPGKGKGKNMAKQKPQDDSDEGEGRKKPRTLSQVEFTRLCMWVEKNRERLLKKPPKKPILKELTELFKKEVAVFSFNRALDFAGIMYNDREARKKPGGARLSHDFIAEIFLKLADRFQQMDSPVLTSADIERLRKVRDWQDGLSE